MFFPMLTGTGTLVYLLFGSVNFFLSKTFNQ